MRGMEEERGEMEGEDERDEYYAKREEKEEVHKVEGVRRGRETA